MIISSSYDNHNREPNNTLQLINIDNAFANINKFGKVWGVGFYEFSDEWWASTDSDAGFDIEGCPNSNPYAHSPCGIRVQDGLVNVEWLGMYSIKYLPFRSCKIPKNITKTIQWLWLGTNTSSVGDTVCAAFFPSLISFLPYPISATVLFGPFAFVMFVSFAVIFCPIHKETQGRKQQDQVIDLPEK